MLISFDPVKDWRNRRKHGVSLSLAAELEWSETLAWEDRRCDYGEMRMAGLGYIGRRLYSVVFVDRLHERRIISLRKANSREVMKYAQA